MTTFSFLLALGQVSFTSFIIIFWWWPLIIHYFDSVLKKKKKLFIETLWKLRQKIFIGHSTKCPLIKASKLQCQRGKRNLELKQKGSKKGNNNNPLKALFKSITERIKNNGRGNGKKKKNPIHNHIKREYIKGKVTGGQYPNSTVPSSKNPKWGKMRHSRLVTRQHHPFWYRIQMKQIHTKNKIKLKIHIKCDDYQK